MPAIDIDLDIAPAPSIQTCGAVVLHVLKCPTLSLFLVLLSLKPFCHDRYEQLPFMSKRLVSTPHC